MLEKQQLILDHDKRGTVHLYNTYNVAEEAELARELANSSGETVKLSGDMEVKPLGYIPKDEWLYNPWLIEADRARRGGDMGEFTRLINKYFEMFPRFKAISKKKYY